MAVAYCFVEVFNKNSQQWEFIYNFNEKPEYDNSPTVSSYNGITKRRDYYYCYPELAEKVKNFFIINTGALELLHCFKKIENRPIDCEQWKGIPENASAKVKNDYDFLVGEVRACYGASHFYLYQLLHFDYDQTFDIYKLPQYEYKQLKEYSCEDKKNNREKHLSYRDYLGKAYFDELESLELTADPFSLRIIYLVDDFLEFMYNEISHDILLCTIKQNSET